MRNQETIRLKEKVGIIDIALSLGYLIDRHAGVGKFVEMVHLDGRGNQMDDIVIKHPNDKGQQKFFHRISRQSGDVFDFIIENINSFSVDGKSDFEKAKKVMRQFANEPVEESEDRKYLAKAIAENSKPFDASRYETASVAGHEEFLKRILGERCIRGASLILVNTERGERVLEEIAPLGRLVEAPLVQVQARIARSPLSVKGDREAFWRDYRELGYAGLIARWVKRSRKRAVRYYTGRWFKRILGILFGVK